MDTKWFETSLYDIAYRSFGEGPDLVLIHGYGEDSSIWAEVHEAFVGYRVTMIDLPGFGMSVIHKAYTLQQFGADILQLLSDEGVDQFILMGHSMGGYTSSEIIHLAPERVRALGMVHSHPFGDNKDTVMARNKAIDHLTQYGSESFTKGFVRKLYSDAFFEKDPETVENMISKANEYPAQAFVAGMEAMRDRENRRSAFEKFERPVLFIVGEKDAAVPDELSKEQLSLPNIASVHILKGIGHTSMIEAPDSFIEIIKTFLDFVEEQGKVNQ